MHWKDSEATKNADDTFDCVNSDVTVTQLVVAVDGLSVVVKKGGAADQCLNSMGGISMAQRAGSSLTGQNRIRSRWNGLELYNSNNDGDDLREWGDLSHAMTQRLHLGRRLGFWNLRIFWRAGIL